LEVYGNLRGKRSNRNPLMRKTSPGRNVRSYAPGASKADREKVREPGEPQSREGSSQWMDVELEYDTSAYKLLHRVCLEWPCLSFDWCRAPRGSFDDDELWLVLGSQASSSKKNGIYVVHLSNLIELSEDNFESSFESEESDSDREARLKRGEIPKSGKRQPRLSSIKIPRHECMTRVRCLPQAPHIVACWGDACGVSIWDISDALFFLPPQERQAKPLRKERPAEPVFHFRADASEGFALDWSALQPGLLAAGNSIGKIAIFQNSGSTWSVNCIKGSAMLNAHAASVEDIQWSPTNPTAIASCSCDRSIKIHDLRDPELPSISCMEAHSSDVNAIAWNRFSSGQIVSGDDDGHIKVWDLRMIRSRGEPIPVASFLYHRGPIYSIEWNRVESSMFCVSSGDDSISVWDLSLEPLLEETPTDEMRDLDQAQNDKGSGEIPPQLLFIHEGMVSAREAHWIERGGKHDLLAAVGQSGLHVFLPANIYATED
jgi:ribosome assembly protein RRB1